MDLDPDERCPARPPRPTSGPTRRARRPGTTPVAAIPRRHDDVHRRSARVPVGSAPRPARHLRPPTVHRSDRSASRSTRTPGSSRSAGVSRRGVYLHFDSVAALVAGLFDHIADTGGLAESVERALQRVGQTSAAAAAHRARVRDAQIPNCRRIASWLASDGQLADGWDVGAATDLMYGLISSEVIGRLLDDRRWSRQQLAERLSLLLRSTLPVPTGDRNRPADARSARTHRHRVACPRASQMRKANDGHPATNHLASPPGVVAWRGSRRDVASAGRRG